MKTLIAAIALPVATLLGVHNSYANVDVDLTLTGGAEYVDNLSIPQLDQVSYESDSAAVLEAGLGLNMQPTDKLNVSFGYLLNQRDYHNLDNYDQTIHTFSADANYQFDLFTLGASHHFAYARLDGQHFLDLNITSIYMGKLLANGLYLRPTVTQKQKQFTSSTERNSDSVNIGAEMYWFFNQQRSFFAVGLMSDDEDADAAIFDNDATLWRTRFSTKLQGFGKEQQIQLAWRYVDRQYHEAETPFSPKRHDQRHNLELQWLVNLTEHLQLISKAEWGRYDSTLPSADYDETRYSLKLSANF